MNILILNWQDWTNPLSGGAEIHLHQTFKRIAAMGHRVTLLCCGYEGAAREETIDGITILRRGSRNTFNFVVPFEYLLRLRHEAFDVVIDDLNKIPFYTPLFVRKPLLALCHHFFGSTIFQEVGVAAGSYVYLSEQLVPLLYKRTPFLTVSPSTIEEMLTRGFSRSQFTLAMNAIDHELLRKGTQAKSEKPLFAYLGRLKKYKQVDHLLRAFALVRRELPTAELRIVGRGDDEARLRALAKELQIEDACTFVGFVSQQEKPQLLEQLWAVVNPSIKEGWGIVNIEANACGTPAIAADNPGLRDSVRHNETGLLYPSGDITALAETMIQFATDEALRTRLAEGGLRFAQQFTWDLTAQAVLTAINAHLATKQLSPALEPQA